MNLQQHNDRPRVLFWARHGTDYSRNRVLHGLFLDLGWQVAEFTPCWSPVADLQAILQRLSVPDLVWVPCFRQRDLPAALRWARRQRVPLIFDPLISAYDKQVFERGKYPIGSRQAERLRLAEQKLLQQTDLVLADTAEHARFFVETFSLSPQRLAVIPVGAEESLFRPLPPPVQPADAPLKLLFYGSFIGLQGPQVIVEAARLCRSLPVEWTLVGEGPLREECRRLATGLSKLRFAPWQPYERLPETIAAADVVLGIFGTSDKAARVIPNKVYQALACGRPLITRTSPAYLPEFVSEAQGIRWVEPGSAQALADAVAELAAGRTALPALGQQARATYERYFSQASIREQLRRALEQLLAGRE